MSAVQLEEVSVAFPRRDAPVLDQVDLQVREGGRLLVAGPSGCGKSTLLQVITGVVPHTQNADMTGRVQVAGQVVTDLPVASRSRRLGVLAQDPAASLCLPTAQEEIAMVLENHQVPPEQIELRIRQALQTAGVDHLRDRPAHTLSGGEVQRVGLAAALAARPDVLILDEPTSMLDAAGVDAVRETTAATMTAAQAPALVMVEHRLDEWAGARGAEGLPGELAVLDHAGRLLAVGPTAQVLATHAATLHEAGCWLPSETELQALTGRPGGLACPATRALLRDLARQAPAEDPSLHGEVTLRARQLTVGHDRALLKDLDLEIDAGEVVALVGANGTGKSTLLLTLAGLLAPIAGAVDGGHAGLVFQNPEHQFLAQTVAEEIGWGLRRTGRGDGCGRHRASRRGGRGEDMAREVRIGDIARRFRLGHLLDQNPFRLSGGEKRRLSLAAMVATDRPVLMADEPTLGLDRRDAIATMTSLHEIAGRGTGVLLTSHDLRSVTAHADRVIVIGGGAGNVGADGSGGVGCGRVLADGPPASVLADADLRAAAGMRLPEIVSWLFENVGADAPHVLRRLEDAHAGQFARAEGAAA
jgi:energy-coupling factor transporter ATP-binding protein EcfA2